ncbi:hypothetical protein CLAFUW4_12395 [Fulvia fulva]|uniref:2EXR domain-containing protein n=1 Tax=Passalora fulva TaxID=5499 RepID=A0A9Q8PER7_PASFU|nr:uncharacterized protein CLAFUR5_11424 [Fulvia fulva]KAK4617561.1 hypothetical protein CLAFUR4_12400 [Fulvia fulva]KAK4618628.1 hypothetical protein CLAFUR0_12411 [Fulvia fulva]UJO21156.1 hypothetical protein CLAFUR5_11424 [Fulvia fulva]WPV18636.1 hypothetical protein CLAFUW4_12395 [Fulvia fulva]WPV33187.1 hypothetical protein CLAFUW7_12402 [Fulvia fulva]
MSEPRNLILTWTGDDFKSNTPPPNVAHVCHEAREETLKQYELTFASRGRRARILFGFSKDTLYITDDALIILLPQSSGRIQRLKHFRNDNFMAQKCSS